MKEETTRKLKIENLTRCMNCSGFVACCELRKEDIVDCQNFKEVGLENQVTLVNLKEAV
jgi:hypothetical protein